jgi:oligoribonuclease NrnB/cAMP/cGMP phosphodiesterase (DHH superfamily)
MSEFKGLCIYHGNCADGFGAACIVRMACGEAVEFFAGHHGESPPDVTGRDVLIVDFSYKRDVLIKMSESARTIDILDHHKSAQEDLVDLPANVVVEFDMNRSGAMMTWDFFYPKQPAPKLIQHIQDRDLWKFELEGTREIQAGLFSYEYDFDVWEKLIRGDQLTLDDLYRDGVTLYRKQMKDINEFIAGTAHRVIIANFDVPALNAPHFWSSEASNILAKGEPFAACYWNTAEGTVYSLRSHKDGEDVSKIAFAYGGGGHTQAAGFLLKHGETL